MRARAGVLRRGRKAASESFGDHCIVQYDTGEVVRNPDTFKMEPVYATRFASPCRVKDPGYADTDQQVAGRRESLSATQIQLPWDAPAVKLNDRVTLDDIAPTTPPRMLGKSFYAGTNHDRSEATATRLVVREDPWPPSQ